jgi:hypothetical protein
VLLYALCGYLRKSGVKKVSGQQTPPN